MELIATAQAHESEESQIGKLGLWLFLLSEVMLFGGFFVSYFMLRWGSSVCALGTPVWPKEGASLGLTLAAVNTLVLITSSFTMVRALGEAKRGCLVCFRSWMAATVILGVVFLAIKASEYFIKIHHGYYPQSEFIVANPGLGIFVSFYFALTGLHALHVLAGLFWNGALLFASSHGNLGVPFVRKVEYAGLYWHFVDIVWVFLFPLFYFI